MHPYPHHYVTSASGAPAGEVRVSSPRLPDLTTTAPPEFGGPEGNWSPETLLCASVADCFILTFRAVSRVAKLEWQALECEVTATLERAEGKSQFTRFLTSARLTVPPDVDPQQARALLEKAEHGCLVANSLRGARELQIEIVHP